jgi:hypothetical protein
MALKKHKKRDDYMNERRILVLRFFDRAGDNV